MLRPLVLVAALVLPLLAAAPAGADDAPTPMYVGNRGNEPLVRVSPDGTVYVSALQHLFRSTNAGATWTYVSPPFFAANGNLATDSALAFSPSGDKMWMAFDWPYAGSTELCSSRDRGATWICNPFAVPGVTDRMWIKAFADGHLLLVTDVGLYFAVTYRTGSGDVVDLVPVPSDGPNGGWRGDWTQGWGPTAYDDVVSIVQVGGLDGTRNGHLLHYSPEGTFLGSEALGMTGTGLAMSARDAAGNLYGLREGATGLTLVRKAAGDGAVSEVALPLASKARLSSLGAGPTGKVAVVYYGETSPNRWAFFSATTTNAMAASPTWSIAQRSPGNVHAGSNICWSGCTSVERFAGDFTSVAFDAAGSAWSVYMDDLTPPPGPPRLYAVTWT